MSQPRKVAATTACSAAAGMRRSVSAPGYCAKGLARAASGRAALVRPDPGGRKVERRDADAACLELVAVDRQRREERERHLDDLAARPQHLEIAVEHLLLDLERARHHRDAGDQGRDLAAPFLRDDLSQAPAIALDDRELRELGLEEAAHVAVDL